MSDNQNNGNVNVNDQSNVAVTCHPVWSSELLIGEAKSLKLFQSPLKVALNVWYTGFSRLCRSKLTSFFKTTPFSTNTQAADLFDLFGRILHYLPKKPEDCPNRESDIYIARYAQELAHLKSEGPVDPETCLESLRSRQQDYHDSLNEVAAKLNELRSLSVSCQAISDLLSKALADESEVRRMNCFANMCPYR